MVKDALNGQTVMFILENMSTIKDKGMGSLNIIKAIFIKEIG
tara:strand:- start:267 stop:392 length:126 start_codon:yes stop_codon:yes gene_type:complete